jgi:hypothetical protein
MYNMRLPPSPGESPRLTNGATGEAGSMFEQSVSYEAAYLAKFPSTDEDLPTAFRWAVERRGRCYTGAG